jgi:hypothetical protein|tara:strand:+ start:807 stop:1151 length:345 start_codon:yes stop_codon:yes gene_type:complete
MDDAALLVSINLADISRNITSMSGRDVKSHIDATEFAGKTEAQKQQVIELLKRDDLNLHGLDKEILVDIFGASTTTTALAAARTELVSPATLAGLGVVTMKDLRMHTLSRKVPS